VGIYIGCNSLVHCVVRTSKYGGHDGEVNSVVVIIRFIPMDFLKLGTRRIAKRADKATRRLTAWWAAFHKRTKVKKAHVLRRPSIRQSVDEVKPIGSSRPSMRTSFQAPDHTQLMPPN